MEEVCERVSRTARGALLGLAVDRRVGDGLDDLDRDDVGDPGGRGLELGVGAVADEPGDDLAPGEGVDVLRRRQARERLPQLGDGGEHHVGAHGRHVDVVAQGRADLHHAAALGHLAEVEGRFDDVVVGGALGRGLVVADQLAQAFDQRRGLDRLRAGLVDRVDRGLERVQALEQHVDLVALEPVAALAQQLEDVLHLVRERRHAAEAHRRAHALQRMRDAEDLVDGGPVLRRVLDPDDRQVELLKVLPALGQEHREVLRKVVHTSVIGR